MEAYQRRHIDDALDEFQPHLAAVVINGAKGVGKTLTASRRARSTLAFDKRVDRERFDADPTLLTTLPAPVLVDEWQRRPDSWDLVRRAVDEGAEKGRFILAGSATTPRGVHVHSGAGRIVDFRMRPMSLVERGVAQPAVSMAALFDGRPTIAGDTTLRLSDYVEQIVASGFPDITAEPARIRGLRLDAYLDNLVQREFADQGYPVRRPQALRAWLEAYAASTGTTTSYAKILDAATPGVPGKPSRTATTTYRDVLAGLWLLDPVEAWLPTRNRLDRLAQAPKHFLADPALAARLLNVNADALMRGDQGRTGAGLREGTLLGALFEHLAVLSLQTYAPGSDAQLFHLRTRGGDHEIDAIIERRDGRVIAVETKLTQAPTDADVRHLLWLRTQIGDDLADMMILTTGEHAYRRRDGVAVVPLGLLGP